MYRLKKLPAGGIESALRKAERYRLLGEPCEAESICADILDAVPGHHEALIVMLLSLTDQFQQDLSRVGEAKDLADRLEDDYERAYYSGIVTERQGKAQLTRARPTAESNAEAALRKAMDYYEQAYEASPPDHPDAVLRWNTCARTLARHGHPSEPVEPAEEQESVQLLE